MDERENAFFYGVLTGFLILGVFLLVCSSISSLRAHQEGTEALATIEIDYMLHDRIKNDRAVVFATDEGRIIYHGGSLFKEME